MIYTHFIFNIPTIPLIFHSNKALFFNILYYSLFRCLILTFAGLICSISSVHITTTSLISSINTLSTLSIFAVFAPSHHCVNGCSSTAPLLDSIIQSRSSFTRPSSPRRNLVSGNTAQHLLFTSRTPFSPFNIQYSRAIFVLRPRYGVLYSYKPPVWVGRSPTIHPSRN